MHRPSTRPAALCRWLLLLCVSAATAADFNEPFEPRGELTLAAAIEAALQRNPALRSAEFGVRSAEAQIAQARLRPAPEIGLTVENFGGGLGNDARETTLSLSQVVELGGKRGRREDVARYGRDVAAIEREARQLDILAEVTRRFIDVAAQQQQLLLIRRGAELSESTLAAITARVAAARTPEAEKNRAQILLGRTRLEQRQSEQNLLSAHRRLAALWNSTAPRFGDVSADLFELPSVESFDALFAKLTANPDLLRFASEARLRDAEWQLALAAAKTDVTIGGGLRRFEETGTTGFVVSVAMPLPLANRNQGAIRAAALRREQVDSDRQSALLDAQATLFEFYQTLQQSRATVTALREQLIPQAEAALQQTQYGYQRGRFSYLELADTQRELLALQRDAIAAAATFHRTRAEIERLTNTPLGASQE